MSDLSGTRRGDTEIGGAKEQTNVPGFKGRPSTHIILMQREFEGLSIF